MTVREHLGHLGVNGRIILKRILSEEGVDWIHLAQKCVQQLAFENMVMTLCVP
jgi:hypothetical protein